MEFHPIANKFPLLEGEDFEALCHSMKEHGFNPMFPIVRYEGKILSGRNRYRAAKKTGVAPEFTDWDGEGGTPENFAWQENLLRSHYDATTRAWLAVKRRDELAASGQKPPTLAATAKLEGVSERYLKTAKKVMEKADDSVKELIDEGKVVLTDAERVAELPPKVQKAAAKRVDQGKSPSLTQAAKDVSGNMPEEMELVDSTGQPVPAKLADVFASTLVPEIIQTLNRVQKMLNSLQSWHPFLSSTKLRQAIIEFNSVAELNSPYAVCMDCGGKACKTCRLEGWLPKWRYDEETKNA